MAKTVQTQIELFDLDSPLKGGFRGERSLMSYPFFSLDKRSSKKPIRYATGTVSIEVGPGPKGIATIYDKEVLLYIASLMAARLDEGQEVTQDFHFTAHDLFRVTGANMSSRSYARLSDALERLQGTQIKTDIEAGGEGEAGFFSWLEAARLQYTRGSSGERRLKAVRVRLCDWLFRAILHDRQILRYSQDYFKLGPLNRRLYEVALATSQDSPTSIDIETLRLQVGYQGSTRHFKAALKDALDREDVPDFRIGMTDSKGGPGAAATTIEIRPNSKAKTASLPSE